MVKVIQKENKGLWQCEECGFYYADSSTSLTTGREWAEKCEVWCREHQSCNIEITAHTEENKRPAE
jgi:ribosomal protein L37AE/L43A